MILITITALYASTVYNYAIARSNAELVENAGNDYSMRSILTALRISDSILSQC